ncbi:DNA ligase [Gracilariopsis chorda]|uniref:DNA ligase n=1 Tax=Gracilariopsis chorda TaxID=448386 RepID=A0A2V3IW52_9FLOR|nr:DNA ligase [Gracilariopsis chorda]|eukprot:PXF45947.1 DNA ligase [Gracilariopsis chorda]
MNSPECLAVYVWRKKKYFRAMHDLQKELNDSVTDLERTIVYYKAVEEFVDISNYYVRRLQFTASSLDATAEFHREMKEATLRYYRLVELHEHIYDLALEKETSAEAVDYQDLFYATVPTSANLFPQRRHRALMLSLDNGYTYSELTAFMKWASLAKSKIAAELKIDGVALSLEYRNGHLCHALTRGTERIGDDVTENVREALLGRGVEECIPDAAVPDMVVIRGELYTSKAELNEMNASVDRALGNPHNDVPGALKHKNPAETKARRVPFICYQCLTGALDEGGTRDENGVSVIVPDLHSAWPTHSKTSVSLAAWRFGEIPMRKTCSGITEAEQFALGLEEDRSSLAMEVDGVVLKLDDARARDAAGHTARAPRGAIAYKFAAQSKVIQLKDIVMQVSLGGADNTSGDP